MMRVLTTLTVGLFIALGMVSPASAGGYGDGKPASAAVQKAACKGLTKAILKDCKKAAKLPSYWVHIDGKNYQRPNGAVAVKKVRDTGTPKNKLSGEFRRLVREFNAAHARIQV